MRGVMVLVQDKASTVRKRGSCLGRLAAWAGVLALALQVLLPLASAQAALSVDQELAASICHSGTSDTDPAPAKAAQGHCPFCQIHASAKLVTPEWSWSAPPRLVEQVIVLPPSDSGVVRNPAHLPHPQRGPPSFS